MVTIQPEEVKRSPHAFPPNFAPPNQWTRKAKSTGKKKDNFRCVNKISRQ